MESSLFGKYSHKTYHLWHCFITRETQIPLLMLWENVQHGAWLWGRVFYELSFDGTADYEIQCIQTRSATG